MITFRHEALECYASDSRFQSLVAQFKCLLAPQLSVQEITDFYLRSKPFRMDAIFICKDQTEVGFASIAFYKLRQQQQEVVVARVAVAVDAAARGGALPLEMILDILADFKKEIDGMPLYFVGYLANALVYNAICERIHDVYPRNDVQVPKDVAQLRDTLAGPRSEDHHKASPFTIHLPFQVKIDVVLEALINKSSRPNIRYFRTVNPDFMKQYVLMVICPMSWDNIAHSREMIAGRKVFRNAS